MTFKHFNHLKTVGYYKPEKIIEHLVDRLIGYLYKPCKDKRKDITFIVDKKKLRRYGLEDEAINWGDLGCVEVIKKDENRYLVLIEEASPYCPNLCRYIGRYMKIWGWDVQVETCW